MAIDTNRLVQIANELKSLDQHREKLLAELQRIAGEISGGASIAPRRGRPPGEPTRASAQKAAVVVRRGPGRPPGSRNQAKPAGPATPAAPSPRKGRRGGLTTGVVDFLKTSGGAHTAGEIVAALKLPKTTSGLATVSTTLVRLAKAGRVKKDKERGYRAA
jgi:hypothetical protein